MSKNGTVSQVSSLFEEIIRARIDVFPFFADLVGSTQYKKMLSDAQMPEVWWIYRQLLFLRQVSEIVQRRSGAVVKTIGDEVFGYFPYSVAPSEILKACVEVVQGFSSLKHFAGEHKIVARVGLDYGSTYNGSILEKVDFDPIGTPVDRCARIVSTVNPGEIGMSDDFHEALVQELGRQTTKQQFGAEDREADLKGIGHRKIWVVTPSGP